MNVNGVVYFSLDEPKPRPGDSVLVVGGDQAKFDEWQACLGSLVEVADSPQLVGRDIWIPDVQHYARECAVRYCGQEVQEYCLVFTAPSFHCFAGDRLMNEGNPVTQFLEWQRNHATNENCELQRKRDEDRREITALKRQLAEHRKITGGILRSMMDKDAAAMVVDAIRSLAESARQPERPVAEEHDRGQEDALVEVIHVLVDAGNSIGGTVGALRLASSEETFARTSATKAEKMIQRALQLLRTLSNPPQSVPADPADQG
ncbi:MAG: hypothetical protein ABIG71_02355 [Candidatus Uhrbacteria bacterium]